MVVVGGEPTVDQPLSYPLRLGGAHLGGLENGPQHALRRRGVLSHSLRFYALRLHEVGMIRSSPNQLIAEGTDWRFLNELKRELKA